VKNILNIDEIRNGGEKKPADQEKRTLIEEKEEIRKGSDSIDLSRIV